jgi:serine/threonine protein kinase
VSDGIVKIIDFGIAKAIGGAGDTLFTRQAQILGTPAYMSPEQAGTDGADVDTRADVYSLGVVHYQLCTGAPPFVIRKPRALSLKNSRREAPFHDSGKNFKCSRKRHLPLLSERPAGVRARKGKRSFLSGRVIGTRETNDSRGPLSGRQVA